MTLTRIRYHGPGFENEVHAYAWDEDEERNGDEFVVWLPSDVLGPCHDELHRAADRVIWQAGWSRYHDNVEIVSEFWKADTLPRFLHAWPAQVHNIRDEFLKALSELGVLDSALQRNELQK